MFIIMCKKFQISASDGAHDTTHLPRLMAQNIKSLGKIWENILITSEDISK